MTNFMKDLRNGTHPSHYCLYGVRLLCLSPPDLPVDTPHTRPIQLSRLYHFLILAMYAPKAPAEGGIRVRRYSPCR